MDKPGCYYRALTYKVIEVDGEIGLVFTDTALEHEREDVGFYFHPMDTMMTCYVPDYYDIAKAKTLLNEKIIHGHEEEILSIEREVRRMKETVSALRKQIEEDGV